MTTDQLLALGILAVALVLFVQGRLRHDVVAFGALMVGTAIGIVPAKSALAGFGHPAVFTVAAVLVISRALRNSGVLDGVAERLARMEDRPVLQTGALMGLVAGLSAFMNNVGALAIVMPIAMETCARGDRPPARMLMPLAFASILGGMMTLIGTPPNLVVSAYRAEAVGSGFAMFEFLPLGLPIALAGITFLVFAGSRLVPASRQSKSTAHERFEIGDYVTEFVIPHDSPLIGSNIADIADPSEQDLEVLGLVRSEVPLYQSLNHLPLRPGDVLIVRADSRVFQRLARAGTLELVGDKDLPREHLQSADVGILEVVVPLGSRLEGRTPGSLRLHTRMGINVLAIARRGRRFEERLDDVELRAGDVLLLQGDIEKMAETAQTYGALPLAERGLRATRPASRWIPVGAFGLAVVLTATQVFPVHVAFGLALTVMVVTRGVTIRQLYEYVDWSVIVLLGAMIPLGGALQSTGATSVIADAIVAAAAGLGPLAVVGLLLLATTVLTNVLNNAATAVVMAPIGIGLAERVGSDPNPFLLAVLIGSSCAFLTPIAHQNNVLVLGPGGYRFGDYWKLGLPLTILTLAMALATLAIGWHP